MHTSSPVLETSRCTAPTLTNTALCLLHRRPKIPHFSASSEAPGFKVPKYLFSSALTFPHPLTPVARMKPSSPGNSRPSPPSHKLELQTLKLEELTVGLLCSVPGSQCHLFFRTGARPHKPMVCALGQSVWTLAPLSFLVIVPQSPPSISSPCPRPLGLRATAAAAPTRTPSLRDQAEAPGAHARWRPAQRTAEAPA